MKKPFILFVLLFSFFSMAGDKSVKYKASCEAEICEVTYRDLDGETVSTTINSSEEWTFNLGVVNAPQFVYVSVRAYDKAHYSSTAKEFVKIEVYNDDGELLEKESKEETNTQKFQAASIGKYF